MIRNTLFFVLLFSSLTLMGQKTELSIFDPLVSKTWKAEGNWGDGSKFVQEISFEYGLKATIVLVKSMGFIDKEQTQLGVRNHGIRQFDTVSGQVKFWEFDVFGGRTEGIVIAEGKNILYQYKYGNSLVTDMWEYVNDTTYNFKVGDYQNGMWKQIYLDTQFHMTTK